MGVRRWASREGGRKSETEHTTPPTSWSVGRVVQHSNRRKPAFSLSWRPTGTPLPTKGLVTIFPFESRSKNRSAQLARLTTNLPPCSRKTPPGGVTSRFTVHRGLSLEGRVPIRGVSRAIAGALPPLPRRNFLRRDDENAFFFRIGSSWTKIIDMRGVSFGKLDFEKTDLGKQEASLGRPPPAPFPDSHIDDFCPRCRVFSKEGRTCRISPR